MVDHTPKEVEMIECAADSDTETAAQWLKRKLLSDLLTIIGAMGIVGLIGFWVLWAALL